MKSSSLIICPAICRVCPRRVALRRPLSPAHASKAELRYGVGGDGRGRGRMEGRTRTGDHLSRVSLISLHGNSIFIMSGVERGKEGRREGGWEGAAESGGAAVTRATACSTRARRGARRAMRWGAQRGTEMVQPAVIAPRDAGAVKSFTQYGKMISSNLALQYYSKYFLATSHFLSVGRCSRLDSPSSSPLLLAARASSMNYPPHLPSFFRLDSLVSFTNFSGLYRISGP